MKNTEEDQEEGATMSCKQWPLRKEISANAAPAAAAVLSELASICTLIEEEKTALKDFLGGQRVFTLIPTLFGEDLIEHRAAQGPAPRTNRSPWRG